MDAVAAVLRGAGRAEGVQEVGGVNAGLAVERILQRTGNRRGDAWCASWVYDVGEGMLQVYWPLPRTASCDVLLAYARRRGLLSDVPKPGDVFLLLRAADDAIHTGFVTAVNAATGQFRTIEGNTNAGGSRDGYAVMRRERGGSGDSAIRRGYTYAFIRWHQPAGG